MPSKSPTLEPPDQFSIERITLKQISVLVLAQLNLERGLGYSLLKLIADPRSAVREYLFENRTRIVNPLGFLLLTVAIATFVSLRMIPPDEELIRELQADPGFQQLPAGLQSVAQSMVGSIRRFLNLWFLASLPGLTLASFLVYRRLRLNVAEHLVINTYLFSVQMLLYAVTLPLFFERFPWLAITTQLYVGYAYIRIFDDNPWKGVIRWFAAVVLSQVFSVLVLSVAAGVLLAYYSISS